MEVESEPLRGGRGRPQGRKLLYLVSVLCLLTLISTIVLSVLYSKERSKKLTDSAPSTPYQGEFDFPIFTPSPWDVSQNHPVPLTFNTSSGTWMSLDISPDGTTIIFDLLGDIYLLNITGGDAIPLRQGVPFETQPRFSPDGKKILFTSDISGCDNLWVMNLETKAEYQVTFEPYYYVSNGFWIDDNTVVANKRIFIETRSIGAGEVWSYPVVPPHPSVNVGTRLAQRVIQAGPEEPFPMTVNNSTSIFYSQNIADQTFFTYNKDPHKVIYAIFKLDLSSMETTMIASAPGGSARPIVSHDKTTLAYIKRTIFQTSLVLHNLATGNEVIVFNDLDFDQQESYAPMGVYPAFAFTPDDSKIFVWAHGNIYSITISSGEVAQIPFSVNVQLALAPTVRFPHPVEDGVTFSPKIISSLSVSGNQEIFSFTMLAATYLYSNGNAEALTAPQADGVFQFSPALDHSNQYIVQVRWTDQNLSTIEVVPLADKTKAYPMPIPAGRLTQPLFSPSGDKIVFIRLPGDILSGSTYSLNGGVYIVDVTKSEQSVTFGTPVLLTSNYALAVAFDAKGSSVFTQSGVYPITVSEISVAHPDTPTTIATGLYATEIAISPDKKFVAFIEFQHVYIAPYQNGKVMNVTSLSVQAKAELVSATGGQFLTWASNSSAVYWVWGPTIYELKVSAHCKENCVTGNLKSYPVNVVANSTVAEAEEQVVAFFNATILTMEKNGTQIIQNGTLIVKGDKIQSMGPANTTEIPAGAIEIDVLGGYIMPGYIDAHAHWEGAWTVPYKVYADWEMFANLAFGVTTLHNPSADSLSVFQDAELIRAGKKVGPRIFSTGGALYGNGGPRHCDIASVENATDYLLTLQAVGGWSTKSYTQPCRAARQKLLAAARNLSFNVVPEGGMSFFWNVGMIIDGHTTIEHSIPVAMLYDDVITLFAKSGTSYTPTLVVNFGGLWGDRYWFQHTEVWADERLKGYVPDNIVQPATMRFVGAQDLDYHHFATSKSAADILHQGGNIETGAHGQMQGIGFHWEMQMFNQSGSLSPYEVLQTGTINPAIALGLDGQIGSLLPGKLADLVFYDASNNPLVGNTENVKWVMKNGHLYDASSMNQILPVAKDRAPLPALNLNLVNA